MTIIISRGRRSVWISYKGRFGDDIKSLRLQRYSVMAIWMRDVYKERGSNERVVVSGLPHNRSIWIHRAHTVHRGAIATVERRVRRPFYRHLVHSPPLYM